MAYYEATKILQKIPKPGSNWRVLINIILNTIISSHFSEKRYYQCLFFFGSKSHQDYQTHKKCYRFGEFSKAAKDASLDFC